MSNPDTLSLADLTADIVSAYVSNTTVASGELSTIVADVYKALSRAADGLAKPDRQPLKPAVSVRESVHPDYVTCLEDGKQFKSMKRHLRQQHNLTPAAYREKWSLPDDYRMVASNYAGFRSEAAKRAGFGRKPSTPKDH